MLFGFSIFGCAGQKADSAYTPKVATPAYATSAGPTMCIDQAHNNSHTAGGLYRPFAQLLAADGYRVESLNKRLADGAPTECSALVIVNAAGGKTYKLFGLNLPTKSREGRPNSAFTRAEIEVLHRWIERGGALLLIADHYPYGSAASTLAAAFGVDMSGGFTEALNFDSTSRDRGQLVYSRENGLLAEHPITTGRNATERVMRVVTFTGQSLFARDGTPLLILGDSAVDLVPPGPQLTAESATGRSQAIALEVGLGRVVILGEAAALTAQFDDNGHRFGMQVPGNDNAQFALNIMHWLTGLI